MCNEDFARSGNSWHFPVASRALQMKRKTKILVATLLGFGAVGVGIGFFFRKDAGGIWHVPTYLYSHYVTHTDLYSPDNAFLKHGNRELKEIALTIDDGPHASSLPRILNVLKEYGVKATFFPVGKRIKEHPELVRRMLAEGHEVGNHTQDHIRLNKLRPDQIESELKNWDTNFYRATGRKAAMMRPPGMSFDDKVMEVVKRMGYVTIGWTAGAKDFVSDKQKEIASPLVVGDRILSQADKGGILLLHDAEDTAAALPHIIRALKNNGYTLVTVTEMMKHLPEPINVPSNAGALTADELRVVEENAPKLAAKPRASKALAHVVSKT